MMVGMPRPGSPIRMPWASLNSTSLLELLRLPTLFLRRCTSIGFLLPSGRQRGTKKQLGPPSAVRATTRCASHMGAEKNHLCPRSVNSRSPWPVGVAVVVLARTSEPPCFSVMPMPTHIDFLSASGTSRSSYSGLSSWSFMAAHKAGSR